MTTEIEDLIAEIESETVVSANSKVRIANVLRKISNENKSTPKLFRANIKDISNDLYEGELVVGKRYVIYQLSGTDDFTNVGFLEIDEPFIATGTTPTIWQSNTEVHLIDFQIDVLENTIDDGLTVDIDDSSIMNLYSPNEKLTNLIFRGENHIQYLDRSNARTPFNGGSNSFGVEILVYGEFIDNLTGFLISSEQDDECSYTEFDTDKTAYHNGNGQYPVIGDTVYSDQFGTLYPDNKDFQTYYMANDSTIKIVNGVSSTWQCK